MAPVEVFRQDVGVTDDDNMYKSAFKTVTDIVSELFKLSKTQNLKVPGDKEVKVLEL